MDLVGREEFEAARAMAAKAREEQEKLLRRVEELETRLAALEQGRRDGRGTSTS
jgi:BMFP domain-containing protein YqiC